MFLGIVLGLDVLPGVTMQVVEKQGVLVALLILDVEVGVAPEHRQVVAHPDSRDVGHLRRAHVPKYLISIQILDSTRC